MATLEELTAEARAEVESQKPLKKVTVSDGVTVETEYSEDEYELLIVEQGKGKLDAQENGYKNDRAFAYGSLESQLDMQFHDAQDGTTTWVDHVAQVKADYPKPS